MIKGYQGYKVISLLVYTQRLNIWSSQWHLISQYYACTFCTHAQKIAKATWTDTHRQSQAFCLLLWLNCNNTHQRTHTQIRKIYMVAIKNFMRNFKYPKSKYFKCFSMSFPYSYTKLQVCSNFKLRKQHIDYLLILSMLHGNYLELLSGIHIPCSILGSVKLIRLARLILCYHTTQ